MSQEATEFYGLLGVRRTPNYVGAGRRQHERKVASISGKYLRKREKTFQSFSFWSLETMKLMDRNDERLRKEARPPNLKIRNTGAASKYGVNRPAPPKSKRLGR